MKAWMGWVVGFLVVLGGGLAWFYPKLQYQAGYDQGVKAAQSTGAPDVQKIDDLIAKLQADPSMLQKTQAFQKGFADGLRTGLSSKLPAAAAGADSQYQVGYALGQKTGNSQGGGGSPDPKMIDTLVSRLSKDPSILQKTQEFQRGFADGLRSTLIAKIPKPGLKLPVPPQLHLPKPPGPGGPPGGPPMGRPPIHLPEMKPPGGHPPMPGGGSPPMPGGGPPGGGPPGGGPPGGGPPGGGPPGGGPPVGGPPGMPGGPSSNQPCSSASPAGGPPQPPFPPP